MRRLSNRTGVVRHAPDEHNYHMADDILSARVGRGRSTIPRGNDDGSSKGFNAHAAGLVHIDPDENDGGVVVDLATIKPRDMLRVLSQTTSAYDALAKFAIQEDEVKSAPQGDAMTPIQIQPPPQAPSIIGPRPNVPASPPVTVSPILPPQPPMHYQPVQYSQPPDPNIAAAIQQLTGLVTILSQEVHALKTAQAPVQQAQEDAMTEVRSAIKRRPAAAKAPIDPLAALNLPYVTADGPQPPSKQVVFELPTGKMSAVYHSVIDAETCIVLVYDTRSVHSTQWLPEDTGSDPLTIHVPSWKKSFVVASMGLIFTEGVFDYVVLVKVADNNSP